MVRKWFYKYHSSGLCSWFHVECESDAEEVLPNDVPQHYTYYVTTPENWTQQDVLNSYPMPMISVGLQAINPGFTSSTFTTATGTVNWNNLQSVFTDTPVPQPQAISWDNEEGLMPVKDRRYDTPHDVKMRLHDTIIRFKGLPVLVQNNGETLKVKVTFLTEKRDSEYVDSSSPDLDISSPPLGYVNSGKESLDFVFRNTYRQQKQGISRDNCMRIQEVYDKKAGELVQIRYGGLPDHQPLGLAILGVYPLIDECVSSIKKSRASGSAFNRSYALVRCSKSEEVFRLKYKTETMGVYIPKEDLALVRPEYIREFHTEQLRPFMKLEKVHDGK